MLVSTTFSALPRRGSGKAFTECLGVRNALNRSGKIHSHHCPARQQAEMLKQFTLPILNKKQATWVGKGERRVSSA